MNESLVKYLAGLLDADGSLSFTFRCDPNNGDRHNIGLMLSLASSDAVDQHDFVSSLPELTGMGGIYRYGARRQFLAWRVAKRADLEMLLPRLIKHMVIKASHWHWLFETWREKRGALYARGSHSSDERAALTEASRQSRKTRHGPLKSKNHPTWAWLAGYLDGDGWYRMRYQRAPQNYWSMHVGAVAHENDADVLRFLQKAFGGAVRLQGQSPHVLVWVRNLGAKDSAFALRFLPNLARHARLKRHKIDQLIAHHRQRLSTPTPAGEATV